MRPQLSACQTALDKAKKENDYVYHERVPDYKTLAPIERACIAKVTPIKLPVSDDFRDLFATLVPINVHNGLQAFKAKKMEAFNMEIGKLRQATDLLNTALSAWNLPAAIEDVNGGANGGNKIPQSLLDKSQVIKDRGGIVRINQMIAELPTLLARNTDMLAEAKRCLSEEEKSDTELRAQLKDKWTRTPSRQLTEYLHAEIRQYEQIVENAIKANKVIDSKYKQHQDGIALLSKPVHEIGASLPAATATAALQNTHVVKDLRRLLNECDALRNVREVLESEMKSADTSPSADAQTAKLIGALQSAHVNDEHAIIQDELDAVCGPMRKQVRENIQEQEKLLGYIEKANGEFAKEKVHNETSKLREEMLRNLAAASDSYNELYNHLEEGIKFYNDLTPILLKFQGKLTDFVFARKTEKDDLMKEIQTSLSRPTPPTASSSSSAIVPPRPPPPATTSSSSSSSSSTAPPLQQQQSGPAPPYPTYQNPYFAVMPNVYYPYSMQGMPPQPSQQHQSMPPPFNPAYPYQGYPSHHQQPPN